MAVAVVITPRSREGVSSARASSGKLVLDETLPLGAALATAMRDVLDHAARKVGEAPRRPAVAVHELRKSIRRARAVLKLSEPILSGRTTAALTATLRALQARTSPLRDADILLPAIAALRRRGLPAEARRALVAFAAELHTQQRRARAEQAVPAALAGTAEQLQAVGMRFALALPAQVTWDELGRGLRRIDRRARRTLARARADRDDDDAFHTWRKRTKVLAYGLELCASRGGRHATKERKRFAALAEAQGAVTDLLVLRNRLRPWAAARADAATGRLLAELGERIDGDRRAVERQGRDALARKPRDFVSRVI